MHWVPGHRDIGGNELARQAKEAANEMVGADKYFPTMMDKKESVVESKRNLKDKRKMVFELS